MIWIKLSHCLYFWHAAYIQQSLFEEKESVWIAQRDGRTKDGNDFTKHGLVKMITLGNDKNLMETIRRMKVTPVTVSYEFEPCDKLKAREMAISEHAVYQKKPGEDFDSIKQGIFGQKGRMSLTIGKPLDKELDNISEELSNNDKIDMVCKLIDKQIVIVAVFPLLDTLAVGLVPSCPAGPVCPASP